MLPSIAASAHCQFHEVGSVCVQGCYEDCVCVCAYRATSSAILKRKINLNQSMGFWLIPSHHDGE